MKYSRLLFEWFTHRLNCKRDFKHHSPFLVDFYKGVVEGELDSFARADHLSIYRKLTTDHSPINHVDFGAGSRNRRNENPTVGSIAKSSLKQFKEASLIVRVLDHLNVKNFLELGTSFGLTSYLVAKSLPDVKISTIEGSQEIAAKAAELFEMIPENNINLYIGTFENHLESVLMKLQSLDAMLVDGNHRFQPTIDYFELALKYSHQNTLFIFDDIRWSDDMLAAWNHIVSHSQSTLCLDFFNMGIVFVDSSLKKKCVNICI